MRLYCSKHPARELQNVVQSVEKLKTVSYSTRGKFDDGQRLFGCSEAGLLSRNLGSALDGYAASLDLDYDPVLLRSVASCLAGDFHRVVAFAEYEITGTQHHSEGYFAFRAFEHLKAICGSITSAAVLFGSEVAHKGSRDCPRLPGRAGVF